MKFNPFGIYLLLYSPVKNKNFTEAHNGTL